MSFKYSSKDSPDFILKQIKAKVDDYFLANNNTKNGNFYLILKFIAQLALVTSSVYWVFHATSYLTLCLAYLSVGFTMLMMGINFGHDGAHGCCKYPIFQPRENQTYSAYITPINQNNIKVTGFVWFRFLSQSAVFHRTTRKR